MAFRIMGNEPVQHAIRRLARKQLRNAVTALQNKNLPLAGRVHEVRTSIKKVRALTALARPAVGRRARDADRRLQKAASPTSELRDAEVLLQTFDALLPALAPESGASLRRARGSLANRLRQLARSFEAERSLDELEARLRRARRETKRWVPRKGAWRAARRGLVRGYRDARRAMTCAYDQTSSGRAFHRWRKAVKALRYQLQLFHDVRPSEPALLGALDHLGEVLGAEHDLTVLEQTVGTDRASFPEDRDRTVLMTVIEHRRSALRVEARPLGEQLFAERPRVFRRRLRDELRAGRRDAAQASVSTSTPKRAALSGRHHLRAI